LVTLADARFLEGASGDDWRYTRDRAASDVNAEVRDAAARDGYLLFRIGLPPSTLPGS